MERSTPNQPEPDDGAKTPPPAAQPPAPPVLRPPRPPEPRPAFGMPRVGGEPRVEMPKESEVCKWCKGGECTGACRD